MLLRTWVYPPTYNDARPGRKKIGDDGTTTRGHAETNELKYAIPTGTDEESRIKIHQHDTIRDDRDGAICQQEDEMRAGPSQGFVHGTNGSSHDIVGLL